MDIKGLKRKERELISTCALFVDINEKIISRALSDEQCRLVELFKGDVVVDVHDYRRCLGLVLSGSIDVTKPTSSRYIMNTLRQGNLFGSADLYDDDPEVVDGSNAVTVLTARAACRVLLFPRTLLETLMGEENTIALNYIRFLTGRIRFLNRKIQGLVSESSEAALKQYLFLNATSEDGKLSVHLKGSVSGLAERLNIGRASLYRAFDALERLGLIKKDGKEIQLINPDEWSNMV